MCAVPKRYAGAQFLSKCFDLQLGDKVKILEEFDVPSAINPKLTQGFLLGKVEFQGETYLLGLNKTSYDTISKDYGIDTKDWVGKELEYGGKVPMKSMTGVLWKPVV